MKILLQANASHRPIPLVSTPVSATTATLLKAIGLLDGYDL